MATSAVLARKTARSGAVQPVPLRRAQPRAGGGLRLGHFVSDGQRWPSSSCVAKSALLLYSPAEQVSLLQWAKLYITLFGVGFAAYMLTQQEQVRVLQLLSRRPTRSLMNIAEDCTSCSILKLFAVKLDCGLHLLIVDGNRRVSYHTTRG